VADWQPTSWRDVPASCEVIHAGEPMAMGPARSLAKAFNLDAMAANADLWNVIACTNGRRGQKGMVTT